jgi:hypothetical protein
MAGDILGSWADIFAGICVDTWEILGGVWADTFGQHSNILGGILGRCLAVNKCDFGAEFPCRPAIVVTCGRQF